jgi:hypothetical protein
VHSKLSELGVRGDVAELVIGHKRRGIHATYDRYSFDKEKRDVLERWEAALTAVLEPRPANVVAMAPRQATN